MRIRFSARPLVIAVAVLGVWSNSPLRAQSARPSDYDVKAVYLLNFGRFTTWPAKVTTADSPVFNVCVLGRDPFGKALDTTLNGETIDGKSVAARRIRQPQEALACQILFVSASEDGQWPHILQVIDRAGILTVSDMAQFTARGGMVQFVSQDNRVRFEVNLTAVDHENVILSSELLRVALVVRRATRPGA